MTEEDTFNRLRREPWLDVYKKVTGDVHIEMPHHMTDSFTRWGYDLSEVRQYGWTPEEFIQYAKEKYGKDSVTK